MNIHVNEDFILPRDKAKEDWCVQKWTERMSEKRQKACNFNKELECEITKLTVMYPFLVKSQIRGKALKNLNIPSVMGQIPNSIVLHKVTTHGSKKHILQRVAQVKQKMPQQKLIHTNEIRNHNKDSMDIQSKQVNQVLKEIQNIPSKLRKKTRIQSTRTNLSPMESITRKAAINECKTRKRIPQIFDDLENDSNSEHCQNIVIQNNSDGTPINEGTGILKKNYNFGVNKIKTSLLKAQNKKLKKVHIVEKNKENIRHDKLKNEDSYQLQIYKTSSKSQELCDINFINSNNRNMFISSQKWKNKKDLKNQNEHQRSSKNKIQSVNELDESVKSQCSEQKQTKVQFQNKFGNNVIETRSEAPVSVMKFVKNDNGQTLLPNGNVKNLKKKSHTDSSTKKTNVQCSRKKSICTKKTVPKVTDKVPEKCKFSNNEGQGSYNPSYKIDNQITLPKTDENMVSITMEPKGNVDDVSLNFHSLDESKTRRASVHITNSKKKKKPQKRKLFCTSICKKGRIYEDNITSSDFSESDFMEDDSLSENESNIFQQENAKKKLPVKKINAFCNESQTREKRKQYNLLPSDSSLSETIGDLNKIKDSSFLECCNIRKVSENENVVESSKMPLRTPDETESESSQLPLHSPIQYTYVDSFSSSEDCNTPIEDALEVIDRDILNSETEPEKKCCSSASRLKTVTMLESPGPSEIFHCNTHKSNDLTSDISISRAGTASSDGDFLADLFDPIPEDEHYHIRPMYSEGTDDDNCSTLLDSI